MQTFGIRDIPVESINQESLGIGQYIDSLSEFVLACETPMTISIQGDWGCGKTSSMNMIKEKISDKVVPIWFNTWQFSQFNMQSELSISLLSYFVEELDDKQGSYVNKAKGILKGITKTVAAIGAEQIAGGVIAGRIEGLSAEEIDASKALKNLKEELEKAVLQKLKIANKERIVVFIDDLDRLQPEKAVEMLEVMKLFLDVPKCVFVLAVDYGVVIRGVRKKYGDDIGDEKGKSFFDKIIQLPFNMPTSQYNLDNYFKVLLGNTGVEFDEEDIRIYKNLSEYSVGTNPRGLKRIFNLMLLLNITAKNQNLLDSIDGVVTSERQKVMFAVLCLQSSYEEAYRFLARQKLTEQLLRDMADSNKLREDSRFATLKDGFDEKKLENLAEFMERFIDSLQTKGDDSDTLSVSELKNLEGIIKFSSITAVEEERGTIEVSRDERKQNKTVIATFVDELNKEYKPKLKALKSSFSIYQPRDENYATAFIGINNFEIYFLFDREHFEIYEADNTKAGTSAAIEFINPNFKEFGFNEVTEENGELYSEDFDSTIPFEKRVEKFKSFSQKVIERILEVA